MNKFAYTRFQARKYREEAAEGGEAGGGAGADTTGADTGDDTGGEGGTALTGASSDDETGADETGGKDSDEGDDSSSDDSSDAPCGMSVHGLGLLIWALIFGGIIGVSCAPFGDEGSCIGQKLLGRLTGCLGRQIPDRCNGR